MIALQKVLAAMHDHWLLLMDRCANGVGAFVALGPAHARFDRRLRRMHRKTIVANASQYGAVSIGQHHHAL